MPGSSRSIRLPTLVVWLSFGLRGPGTVGKERLKRGLPALEVAVPSSPVRHSKRQEEQMGTVIIGMDPRKRSATIEVMAADETVLGGGRYGTDAAGYAAMLAYVRRWPQRTWAIEGLPGDRPAPRGPAGRRREQVVDVPPKLPARTRVFTAGQGRKTDATDAHSVALAATRMTGLRQVTGNEQLEILRVLADRRRSLGEDHTR